MLHQWEIYRGGLVGRPAEAVEPADVVEKSDARGSATGMQAFTVEKTKG